MIAIGCIVTYLAFAMWAARWLYGTWRARSIDREQYRTVERAVEFFNDVDRPFVMLGAFAAGLVWPASLPTLGGARLVGLFLAGTPVKSRRELEAERALLAARITTLESELGIGGETR